MTRGIAARRTVPAAPIRAMIDGYGPLELTVIEYQPYEPSAYCWSPGWVCVSDDDTEFFVDEAGDVWRQPENTEVGSVAVIRAVAAAEEAAIEAAFFG